ncbi:MAG: SRPBCC family protein [Roseiflexaceae bacterium]|nr:SRPBCC family protein [Roseiflexaceae bacterium]
MATSPSQVFESYIRTTPAQLWQALTDGALTQQYYYGISVESTWQPGAPYRYATPAGSLIEGEVLEVEAPRRLMTTFRPLWQPGMADLPESTVTWVIEPMGEASKLTLIHTGLDPANPLTGAIMGGWNQILSGLKTLLETGRPLAVGT